MADLREKQSVLDALKANFPSGATEEQTKEAQDLLTAVITWKNGISDILENGKLDAGDFKPAFELFRPTQEGIKGAKEGLLFFKNATTEQNENFWTVARTKFEIPNNKNLEIKIEKSIEGFVNFVQIFIHD